MTTCSGTTTRPSRSASAASADVESVTTATGPGIAARLPRGGGSADDDVHDLRGPDDDLADLAVSDRAHDIRLGQRQLPQLRLADAWRDLQLGADLALDLDDAG